MTYKNECKHFSVVWNYGPRQFGIQFSRHLQRECHAEMLEQLQDMTMRNAESQCYTLNTGHENLRKRFRR
jgi:hypothetical protein